MDPLVWIMLGVAAIMVLILFKKIIKVVLVVAVLVFVLVVVAEKLTLKPALHTSGLDFVRMPLGFKIETFADNLGGSLVSTPGPNNGARLLALKDDTVFVTVSKQGKIYALEDKDKDAKVETMSVFLENLNNPHGIAFYQDWVYIAEEDRVMRIKEKGNKPDLTTMEKVVDLPEGSHWTRTIQIVNDKLLISIGSSCNVCIEEDKRRGTIQQCDLEGRSCKPFATGLRNAVGFIEHEGTIYATDNGRDELGNDLPPDEINILQEGKDYGWPYCYGRQVHDAGFEKEKNPCASTEPSLVDLPAHSGVLGLAVYTGNKFPEEYRGKMFVASHGSWNREPPTGYKIFLVDLEKKSFRDFATGWLDGAVVRGRPVDMINFRDGLLVSDDNAGKVYFVSYEG
ncbi:MAG TPA: PQQ-dependent sugar dehydrogenase [Candidatus Nanoarchaeia archaeon]|nr:PQQ-dependent sugar dehydrogenase [Candidatus Nanoarchaeia archaeon]